MPLNLTELNVLGLALKLYEENRDPNARSIQGMRSRVTEELEELEIGITPDETVLFAQAVAQLCAMAESGAFQFWAKESGQDESGDISRHCAALLEKIGRTYHAGEPDWAEQYLTAARTDMQMVLELERQIAEAATNPASSGPMRQIHLSSQDLQLLRRLCSFLIGNVRLGPEEKDKEHLLLDLQEVALNCEAVLLGHIPEEGRSWPAFALQSAKSVLRIVDHTFATNPEVAGDLENDLKVTHAEVRDLLRRVCPDAPVEPAPVEPAPVEPAPVEPAPTGRARIQA